MDIKNREIDEKLARLRIRDKDSDSRKIWGDVLDERTILTLYRLLKRGFIEAIGGAISTGKEATVFYGLGEEDREIAIKIYRIETSDFREMEPYLAGDPRFDNIKRSRSGIIYTWTQKEYKNLKRASNAGVRVPEPITSMNNVLLMEFIGEEEVPAPHIKDVDMALEETFEKIIVNLRKLYAGARIVHADLSEYNILYHHEPILIDMGQSVIVSHPNATSFLWRDIKNLSKFFERRGLEDLNEKDLFNRITGGL
jgi:Serine/threonine protein kinase involved in cell cycle control